MLEPTFIAAYDVDEDGNLTGLYSDEVDLRQIGHIENVRRASNIEFNVASQEWEVIDAVTGKIVHTNPRRDEAIDWEIENFSPGGPYYKGDQPWPEASK